MAEEGEVRSKEQISNDRKELSVLAAYILIGFISFGYAWNHPNAEEARCIYLQENVPAVVADRIELISCNRGPVREIKSFFAGLVWPIWGTGTLVIAITKWP